MSAEINEIENSKDEIYQLIFVAGKFIWTLNNIVISSYKRHKTYFESITNATINNMSMGKMEEAISEGEKLQLFAQALKNISSYSNTISDIFSKYHEKFNTKQIQLVNTTKKDAKKALKCLIFGYIKQETENKYNLIIPFYLKMICLQFYGYIIMKSNILNINQINTIQYVLTENLSHKQFYFKKICDSKTDGFNAKKFNLKYNKCENSLIIIKT
eukprot:533748_1